MNVDWRDWLPYRIDVAPEVPVVHWCRTGGQRLTEPFFEQDLHHLMGRPFNRALDVRSTIDDAAAHLARHPALPPTAFVFHLGRCGSTLVARAFTMRCTSGIALRKVCSMAASRLALPLDREMRVNRMPPVVEMPTVTTALPRPLVPAGLLRATRARTEFA